MTDMEQSEYETRGRASKASRLASFAGHARPSGKGYTADELARFTDEQWAMLAEMAGCNPPSRETQIIAVSVRRTLERLPEPPDYSGLTLD